MQAHQGGQGKRNLRQWRQPDHGGHRPHQLLRRDPGQQGGQKGDRADPDVQVLVRHDQGHPAQPHDFRGRKGHAGILPPGQVRWQQHALPEARDDSRGVHRPGLHHRKRLGQLPEGRHCLRHHPAGGPEGIRQAAGAHLHPLHQGGDRRP